MDDLKKLIRSRSLSADRGRRLLQPERHTPRPDQASMNTGGPQGQQELEDTKYETLKTNKPVQRGQDGFLIESLDGTKILDAQLPDGTMITSSQPHDAFLVRDDGAFYVDRRQITRDDGKHDGAAALTTSTSIRGQSIRPKQPLPIGKQLGKPDPILIESLDGTKILDAQMPDGTVIASSRPHDAFLVRHDGAFYVDRQQTLLDENKTDGATTITTSTSTMHQSIRPKQPLPIGKQQEKLDPNPLLQPRSAQSQDNSDVTHINNIVSTAMGSFEDKFSALTKSIGLLTDNMHNMQRELLDIRQSRQSSRMSSRRNSPNQSRANSPNKQQTLPNSPLKSAMKKLEGLEKIEETTDKFRELLTKQEKLIKYLPTLTTIQGPAYATWLLALKQSMEKLGIPLDLVTSIASLKVPDDVKIEINRRNVQTEEELESTLFDFFCSANNSIGLKKSFNEMNKLSPQDRDYNRLRKTILQEQVPKLITVMQIGVEDQPHVREKLIKQASDALGTELYLAAIQGDVKRSILNKGRYNTVDELVQRSNDFVSSLPDEPNPIRSTIGAISQATDIEAQVKKMVNQELKQLTNMGIADGDREAKCKIHPTSDHSQADCRQKCKKHPFSNHRQEECRQKNGNNNANVPRICPDNRAGVHANPFWCLFCNLVVPRLENHKCFHCWYHSTADAPILSKDCHCKKKNN